MKLRVYKYESFWYVEDPVTDKRPFRSSYWQAAFNYAYANAAPLVVISNEPITAPSPNVDVVRHGWFRRWLRGY